MKSLIITSPFEPPTHHWRRTSDRSLELQAGRRPAGYEVFDTRNNTVRGVTLDLVNRIRERVDAWRVADYPGVTAVTRQLLEHWRDPQASRLHAFYFCQLEAIETLIWHVEATPEFRQGIAVPGDGGPWERLCSKMATGAGKTAVMAMIVTWQVLNALTYPKRNRDFSRAIFVVAPGLTVRERLQVLLPGHPQNYYDAFALCPNEALRQKLNRVELRIENWHTLMPLKTAERTVVKKGAESDEAYARRVLGPLAACRDLVVLNDEAHHAYRTPAESKVSRKEAELLGIDLDEATRWIEGLDRIHRTRRLVRCFDLSATPFAPSGKTSTEAALFGWVVSDFGLNDAIEAGLVKTPRVVIRDNALPDAQTYRSKLYHLYREPEVADDLNRRGAEPHEPLPQIVQQAYTLLGADWRAARQAWADAGHTSPPVMLSVCNRTETAARVEHYFRRGDAFWPELHAPERTLRVDSRVLEKAELGETAGADKDYEAQLHVIVDAAAIPESRKAPLRALRKEELLRAIVDHVGKRGTAGQDLQNVISVAMLSEGWDAKNVTHIMGLRAFTSQLLCEQVIGRGLRRVSYDTEPVVCPDGVTRALFRPEFVNVFGVPLSIFQETEGGGERAAAAEAEHADRIARRARRARDRVAQRAAGRCGAAHGAVGRLGPHAGAEDRPGAGARERRPCSSARRGGRPVEGRAHRPGSVARGVPLAAVAVPVGPQGAGRRGARVLGRARGADPATRAAGRAVLRIGSDRHPFVVSPGPAAPTHPVRAVDGYAGRPRDPAGAAAEQRDAWSRCSIRSNRSGRRG